MEKKKEKKSYSSLFFKEEVNPKSKIQNPKSSDELVAQMDVVYPQSTLPHSPDLNQINQLCIELVEMQGW